MPLLTLPFDPSYGPLIRMGVAASLSLQQPGGAPPRVELFNFLIDSGASQTSVSTAVAARLQLPILGLVPVKSVTHTSPVREYLADLFVTVFNPPFPLRDLRLLEFPSGGGGVDGLLARDLLYHGLFELNGPARTFTIAF